MTYEDKFYEILKDMYIGTPIKGDSGYVNLMTMKAKHFEIIEEELTKVVNEKTKKFPEFKEELYERLYDFFKDYFTDTGSVYYTYNELNKNTYEKVYSENEDVSLFWKTQMLYYVKTDILYQDIEFEVDGIDYYFDVSKLEHKKNNEKKEIVFRECIVKENKDKKKIIFYPEYKSGNKTTKIDDILKKLNKNGIEISEDELIKVFKIFKKQSEVDYFINKNAKKFLTDRFDIYLYQYMFGDGERSYNKFNEKRINQLMVLKDIAYDVIDFISQFEDELVRIWNKPKFVLNSNYVITIDKLTDEIINKIANHPNLDRQIREWEELGMVEDGFDFNNRDEEKHKHLPIDTKYFKDLELDILGLFDNLDEELDGRLIHSENYQALNTLLPKYKGKVQCIYIDPPFNTGSDFIYVDEYKNSTWLSIIYDRILLGKEFMKEDGSFYLHLDDNANDYGKQILKKLYSEITEIIFDTNATKDEEADLFGYKSFGENFVLKHQTIFYCKNGKSKFNKLWKPNRNTTKLDIGWLDLISEKKEEIEKPKKIHDFNYYIEYWENGELLKKNIEINEKIFPIGDIWNDIFSFTQSEMRVSESFGFSSAQKPENLLRRIIQASTDKGDLILDFFGGIGTTFAVAHKLNRKYLGVELGKYFKEFYYDKKNEKKLGILGRMKWVLYGDKTMKVIDKIRKPHLSKDINWQGGGFFKYYSLEQYEDTLRKAVYKDDEHLIYNQNKSPFEQYVFLRDEKLNYCMEIQGDEVKVDLSKLYEKIDIPETLSNLTGKWIKKITEDEVIFEDGTKVDLNNIDYKMIKPLIWWCE
ncbi:adenine specific DNA methylase Mod [Keratinibaculum paraultunense]|uniref:Adenine specific DNA methylase Mod n=1 Tax=Keratinibaculum paraultunense TaxID=1278232 RepID=A0A4V2UTQ1_9FIRM|nr:DNA methyltransferase [Keratinibaculum paraultunense]QQY79705.1 hypothetical protein JL105_11090 [Keratinibaculum paraultunense]TCS87133.1 adenine specific DNA methylase Mod [Keratinibaculum paraultunense]